MKLITTFTFLLLSLTVQWSHAKGIDCQTDNENLRSMPLSQVTFTRHDGSIFSVQARTANNNKNRAAGFQYVCAETIATTPILFIFERPAQPSFHMNNVVAGIDIAFIRPDSTIDSIQTMKPYVLIMVDKPLYSPSSPAIAAFEAMPNFYKINNIDLNTNVTWQLLSQ